MRRRGDDDERVEDLVEAEPGRGGVGPLERVDHTADRVEDAAERQQDHDERAAGRPERGQVEQRDPAERDVDRRVEPARCTDLEHPEQHARERTRPMILIMSCVLFSASNKQICIKYRFAFPFEF